MADILTVAEAFPPGEYLRDELEARGWTEKEFADILGRPVQTVSEILNAKKQIAPETALAIADALGTGAEVWLNLQSVYNLHRAKSGRPPISDVRRRAQLRDRVPVAELRQRGWLPDTDDPDRLEEAVRELLNISDLSESPRFVAAARRSNVTDKFTPQQTAWLARVWRIGESKSVEAFDRISVAALASDLVHRIHDPSELGTLERWLGECGVVLVNLLPLKSSKLDGATMMLESGTPVIALSSRGDRMDGYLFTLLHELAHLVLGHVAEEGITIDEDLMISSEAVGREGDANRRAAEWIMPLDAEMPHGRPSLSAVLPVAARYRVHPCFVIGRMQWQRDEWNLLRRQIPRVRPFVSIES